MSLLELYAGRIEVWHLHGSDQIFLRILLHVTQVFLDGDSIFSNR